MISLSSQTVRVQSPQMLFYSLGTATSNTNREASFVQEKLLNSHFNEHTKNAAASHINNPKRGVPFHALKAKPQVCVLKILNLCQSANGYHWRIESSLENRTLPTRKAPSMWSKPSKEFDLPYSQMWQIKGTTNNRYCEEEPRAEIATRGRIKR